MDLNQSPDRAYVLESIEHVANLGYLTLIERRALLRNTFIVLKQSQLIDEQPLPPDEQKELMSAAQSLSVREQIKIAQIAPAIGKGLIGILKRRVIQTEPSPPKKHWYNNGKDNKTFPIKGPLPKGWTRGRISRK